MHYLLLLRQGSLTATLALTAGFALLVGAGVPAARALVLAAATAAYVGALIGALQASLAYLDTARDVEAAGRRAAIAMAIVAVLASVAIARVKSGVAFPVHAMFAGLLVTSLATVIRDAVTRRRQRPLPPRAERLVLEGFARHGRDGGSLRLSNDALEFVASTGTRIAIPVRDIRGVRLARGLRLGIVLDRGVTLERFYVGDPLRWRALVERFAGRATRT